MPGRILVVDDSAAFRRRTVELLTQRGFVVLPAATDGRSALDVVAMGGCPDGALIDVDLPDDDGLAVAQALAAQCPAVRIVLTSANARRPPATDLQRSHAATFVGKDELAVADLEVLFGGDPNA